MKRQRKQALLRAAAITALVLLTYFLWDTWLTYPVQLYVVFVHECGHALAAVLTGGEVTSLRIRDDLSGSATSVGGFPFVILQAGYLASAVFGGVLMILAARPRSARNTLESLAVLTAGCGLAFARPFWGLALPFALVCAAVFWWVAARATPAQVRWLLIYLAACSSMYALIDIKEDLLTGSHGRVTDAVLLAKRTGVPAIVWAIGWATASLAILLAALRRAIGPVFPPPV